MAADDNRQPQAAIADEAITIDELADHVGMTVRNLREWRTLGLLPRAEMRGRVGFYSPAVVERVERIKRLHTEGFTLELIARMLDAGGDAADEVLRLAATLRAPLDEEPGRGRSTTDRFAGIVASLEELGLSVDQVLEATAGVQSHTESIAAIFEQVWMEHIWEPFLDSRHARRRAAADPRDRGEGEAARARGRGRALHGGDGRPDRARHRARARSRRRLSSASGGGSSPSAAEPMRAPGGQSAPQRGARRTDAQAASPARPRSAARLRPLTVPSGKPRSRAISDWLWPEKKLSSTTRR